MSHEAEKLVTMANQIATFFHPYPRDEALVGIRDHIRAFWTPKMRQALDLAAPTLDPLVRQALAPAEA